MGFSLIPREMKFFDMFDEMAAIVTRGASRFREMVTQFDQLPKRGKEIKDDEVACDRVIERIIKALDLTFITPFDREDIHTLAKQLDDVMDHVEETAHRFEVFRIDQPTETSRKMANIVFECCKHLQEAIRHCRDLRNAGMIQQHLVEIGKLENLADDEYRRADAALFETGVGSADTILMLIKWRELYAWLEETVDACKEVANTLSEILIKST